MNEQIGLEHRLNIEFIIDNMRAFYSNSGYQAQKRQLMVDLSSLIV